MSILAIDPGNAESAYVVIDPNTCQPSEFAKVPNDELIDKLTNDGVGDVPGFEPRYCRVAIEMVASYGMPVGREVFETCVWTGRFAQVVDIFATTVPVDLVTRHPVKLHHCHSAKAKDSNITQALVDRFAPGQPNHGKGTKAAPGWFHGFAADIWQAYALAVYVADTQEGPPF